MGEEARIEALWEEGPAPRQGTPRTKKEDLVRDIVKVTIEHSCNINASHRVKGPS
jgi:hypothetical protein